MELYNETTEVFHFGPNLRRWFYVVYNVVQSCVINGGNMTSYFETSRGVRRGWPLSPSLFTLAVELLALKICQNQTCKGIVLPNDREVKISQFVDDTTIITNNTESLRSHLQTIERFGTISGLKRNKKKTKAMWLGSMKTVNLRNWNSKVQGIQLKFWEDLYHITMIRILKKIPLRKLEK